MFILILIVCIVVLLAGIGLAGVSLDMNGGFFSFLSAFILICGSLVFGMIWTITPIAKHMSAETCHNWSVQNQRPTKFVLYTYWNWDCLTKTADGHWISTSNYNAYISGQVPK
jgi:hypothetical protein